ncbi:MAG: hypothetical protein JXR96_24140 [Deltaproteobacteria bacterium]|nr:hypothetical protein [Deltaproteobacteria bacterium]
MRYLYGDLSEFPHQDNTLGLLQRFLDMAVSSLKLHAAIASSTVSIDEDRAFVADALSEIEEFEKHVVSSIEAASSSYAPEDVVAVLAEGAISNFARYMKEGRSRVVSKVEARIKATEQEIQKFQAQIQKHLRAFFVSSGVPVSNNSLRIYLRPEGDGYHAESEIQDVIGLDCSYKLDAGASNFFSAPRKVSDLVPGRWDLPVGTRKAWLKKDPVVECMRIDDAMMSYVCDDESSVQIQLLRRGGSGQEGVFLLGPKSSGRFLAWRIDAGGARLPVEPDVLGTEHDAQLTQLFKSLQPHLVQLYRARSALTAVRIEGQEVLSSRRLPELVERMVHFLAPTIVEIQIRSPASSELCLKVEHEGGRREEIYIRKSDLLEKIQTLPPALRCVFAPLHLDETGNSDASGRRPSLRELEATRPVLATHTHPQATEEED